jgi:hypothetical protein
MEIRGNSRVHDDYRISEFVDFKKVIALAQGGQHYPE